MKIINKISNIIKNFIKIKYNLLVLTNNLKYKIITFSFISFFQKKNNNTQKLKIIFKKKFNVLFVIYKSLC